MRRYALLALACTLAGCDRGVALTDASMEEVAQALGGAARQEPGLWETNTTLVAIDPGRGVAPRDVAAIGAQIGRPKVERGCLSAEQAAAPGFGQLRGGRCRFARFVLADGRLDARMRCQRPDATVLVTQQGAYGSTAFDMRTSLRQDAPAGRGMSMTLHLVGRRVGACTPDRKGTGQ